MNVADEIDAAATATDNHQEGPAAPQAPQAPQAPWFSVGMTGADILTDLDRFHRRERQYFRGSLHQGGEEVAVSEGATYCRRLEAIKCVVSSIFLV